MKKNNLWIFLHVPRTGGGTLEVMLEEVPKNEVLLTSNIRYKSRIQKIDEDKLRFILGHATYFGIHKNFPEKNARYFVFLRDPAERQVSHYNTKMQHEKKLIPFEIWSNNQVKNEMVHFLDLKFKGSASSSIYGSKFFLPIIRRLNYRRTYLIHSIIFKILGLNKKNDLNKLKNAKKLLKICWFVGITGKSGEDFNFLLNSMGIKKKELVREGKSKEILRLNKSLREKIYKENPLDVELYNYALSLRKMKTSYLEIPTNQK